MATVARFIVRAPDPRTITVFTTPPIGPDRLTEMLNVAAGRVEGTKVHPANFAADVKGTSGGSSYIFGTGGFLQFATDQTRAALGEHLKTVANVVIEAGFGVIEPLEVDDRVR